MSKYCPVIDCNFWIDNPEGTPKGEFCGECGQKFTEINPKQFGEITPLPDTSYKESGDSVRENEENEVFDPTEQIETNDIGKSAKGSHGTQFNYVPKNIQERIEPLNTSHPHINKQREVQLSRILDSSNAVTADSPLEIVVTGQTEENPEFDIVPISERTNNSSTSSEEGSIIDTPDPIHDAIEVRPRIERVLLDNSLSSINIDIKLSGSVDRRRTSDQNSTRKINKSFIQKFLGKKKDPGGKYLLKVPIETPIQMRGTERNVIIRFKTLILKETFQKIEYICLKIGHKCFGNFSTPGEKFRNFGDVELQNCEFVIIFAYVNFPIKYMVKNTICFPYKYFYKLKNDSHDISEHLHHKRNINYNRYITMKIHQNDIDNNETCQHFDTMILSETKTRKNLEIITPNTMKADFITSNGITDTDISFYDVKDRMLTSLLALLPSNFGCGYSPACENLEYFRLQFIVIARSLAYSYIHNPFHNDLDLWLNPEIEAEENFKVLVKAWMKKMYKNEQYSAEDPKTEVCKFYLACCLLRDCEISTNSFNDLLTGMIEESIIRILVDKSYELNGITTNQDFANEITQALFDFIFTKVMSSESPVKILTLVPIYHLITNLKVNAIYSHEKLDYERNEYWGFPADVQLKWLDHISYDSRDIQNALALAEYDSVLPYTIAMYTLNEGNAEEICNHYTNNPQLFPLSALMGVLLHRLFHNSQNRMEVLPGKYIFLRKHVMESLCNCLTKDAKFVYNDIYRLSLLTITFAVKLPAQYFNSHQFKLCLRLISNLSDYISNLWDRTLPIEEITKLFDKLVIGWYKINVKHYHTSFEEFYTEIQFWEDITTEYSFSQSDEWKASVVKFLQLQFKDFYIIQEYILQVLVNRPIKDTIKEILINELYSRLNRINSEERIFLAEKLFTRFLEIDELEKLNKLLSQILIDEKENFESNSEQHFITWILWIPYFSLSGRGDIKNILFEDANNMLEKARLKFSQLINSINKMSIRISLLKEIVNKRDYFTSLATMFLQMDCNSENTFSVVYEDLNKCISLYEWLEEHKNLLKILYKFVGKINMGDDEHIRSFLADSFDNHSIDTICNFQGESRIHLLQHPEISDIINFVHYRSICIICNSVQYSSIIMRVFKTVINEKAALLMNFDISVFYETNWLPAWDICMTLCNEISDESIIISEMCKYLDATETYETVENQLISLRHGCELYQTDNSIVRQALQSSVRKINTFLTLSRCSQAATLICEMKEMFLIKSDFDVIEKMKDANQEYFQKQLSEMDARVEGITMSVAFLDIDTMRTIKENIHLFLWIRDNINDLKAMKIFVDISLANCGDNRVDVDRITCFSSVCINFAPLIFGIDQDTGCERFISVCDSIEKNNKITKLLKQVGSNMRYWEELKQSHGAVEETTISQLDNIIKCGSFNFNLGESFDLGDMINLTISRENKVVKLYTLEDLNEFSSKCILVVGFSEQTHEKYQPDIYKDFQTFDRTLNIIVDIAKIIIQLEMSGQYEYHSHITYFTESEASLAIIQSKLNSLLQDFKNSIHKARDGYYCLNYYTTSQIVSLQKGIRSFLRGDEDENLGQLYHLLRLLNQYINKTAVQQACKKSEIKHPNQGNIIAREIKKLIKRERSETGLPPQVETEEKFLPMSISPRKDRSLEVYADIKSICKFLEIISKSNTSTLKGERKLPDNMKFDLPNLVVIPSNDILDYVLSLYLTDDDNLPLPFYHEILFCTNQTTIEEVSIFWRRVLMNPQISNKYLFCMVNVENLKYEVAVQAFAEFKDKSTCGKMLKKSEKYSYKLVLICSKEKAGSSYMSSAFEDFKRSNVVHYNPENMKNNLAKKFILSQKPSKHVAWIVDNGKSRVKIVASNSVGAGKSLYINKLKSDMLGKGVVRQNEMDQAAVTVCIHGKQASEEDITDQLLENNLTNLEHGVMFHVDIASTIQLGLSPILFKLLILGAVCNSSGKLWFCRYSDYYVVEITLNPDMIELEQFVRKFPMIHCLQPNDALNTTADNQNNTIDLIAIADEQSRKVNEYLKRLETGGDLDNFLYEKEQQQQQQLSQQQDKIIQDYIKYSLQQCGIDQPSWCELRNFMNFLNNQLSDCDNSDFCKSGLMGEDWKGFKSFVVKFMLQMSKDFATPSLLRHSGRNHDITNFQILNERRWENNPHPYIFFNPDGHTMTFLGFQISPNGHLLDSNNQSVIIKKNIMLPQLFNTLSVNRVKLQENYNKLSKIEKVGKIASVVGLDFGPNITDPDPDYVLTLDNVIKILAILMRFRCNIPVVIMGETGCGKTRLIQFMCSLQALQTGATNMLILKVHGGTTEREVMYKVGEAEKLAIYNFHNHDIDTVLFFDEANTSPAIGLIKEIMCDRRMYGRHISSDIRLQFIAACNPYRRHTKEMLHKLSTAGLGFFTESTNTTDRLGDIPLRELVYRVIELPASMRPLVWDFGQLSNDIEKTYTREIVAKHLRDHNSPIEARDDVVDAMSEVLAGAQNYMRERKDECSFVSLRDVERAMRVMLWFYSNIRHFRPHPMDDTTYSLIISIAICYRARLEEREPFDRYISARFSDPLTRIVDSTILQCEIVRCQQLILDEMVVGPNIAKNNALRENVFMMFVCIELKIPIFVIGKPGSSKSLAKSIISNSMQGTRCPDGSILQNFKQVQIMSYQCSQLSTADGIIGIFNACKKIQHKTGSDVLTACVVLEEVGLAEDSPLLPLKVLHPLLEDSNYGSQDIQDTQESPIEPKIVDENENRVAFIGISNWSLDPAKMNRGIMVSRGDPDVGELIASARGICESSVLQETSQTDVGRYIVGLAEAYHYLTSGKNYHHYGERSDFYGLRDFYSLIKMLVFICDEQTPINRSILRHAVLRNFGGVSDVDPVRVFGEFVKLPIDDSRGPDSSPLGLIRANLINLSRSFHGETRYLLLVTENYHALDILLNSIDMWPEGQDIKSVRVIFGSSFPSDQEYSVVCRNINKIKLCMESGKTIILMNLENLYESLYDALNQYYMVLNNQRYVDLGLGTQRVKCRVHDNFKLIVIADKKTVRERFPTPLVNRLEKHFLNMSSVVPAQGIRIAEQLREWVNEFFTIQGSENRDGFQEGSTFIGYQEDTCISIVFHVMKEMNRRKQNLDDIIILTRCKAELLKMAVTDAVFRLKNSLLSSHSNVNTLINQYFDLKITSLVGYLEGKIRINGRNETGVHFTLATTHSRVLTDRDVVEFKKSLCGEESKVGITSLSLQQFQTEQEYTREIQIFLKRKPKGFDKMVLLVQCERGEDNAKLIACARHIIEDELKERRRGEESTKINVFIVFLIQLNRQLYGTQFASYCGGKWNTVHIDDLRSLEYTGMLPMPFVIGKQIHQLFEGYEPVS